jgi:hypothetical protein
MKKFRNFLIFLIILAIILLITKPSQQSHLDKISEKFKKENPLTGSLGGAEYFAKIISYHDYYFFSVGKISIDSKPISFGIAGFVVVYGSTDLNDYKDKYRDLLPV